MGNVDRDSRASTEYLRNYRYDNSLGRDLRVLVAVKHTTQLRKNREKIERLRRDVRRIGSTLVRPPERGLVGILDLDAEAITADGFTETVSLEDPVGIDVFGSKTAISSRDRIVLFDADGSRLWTFTDSWFAILHSIRFSRDGRRLLVASSGYDTLFEVSVSTGEILWDWNAWEHGYAESVAGGKLFSRNGFFKERPLVDGLKVERVEPSRFGGSGIPVWQRAVHLNGASYDDGGDGRILATLFHQGKAVVIDKASGRCREVVSGLCMPHCFERVGEGYIVTSSGGKDARFLALDSEFRVERSISPSGLPGTRCGLPVDEEWLQYTTALAGGLYAMVDIHRSSLALVHPETGSYRRIGFPRDWAVQMIVRCTPEARLPAASQIPRRAASSPSAA